MIQAKTFLNVLDNSGARKVECIKVLGGFKRKTAKLGDVIVVSVKQLRYTNRYRSKVLKGAVVRALIIKTKNKYKKKDGSFMFLNNNSVILINKQGNLLGTRILSALPKFFKKKKYLKFLSLCKGTL